MHALLLGAAKGVYLNIHKGLSTTARATLQANLVKHTALLPAAYRLTTDYFTKEHKLGKMSAENWCHLFRGPALRAYQGVATPKQYTCVLLLQKLIVHVMDDAVPHAGKLACQTYAG